MGVRPGDGVPEGLGERPVHRDAELAPHDVDPEGQRQPRLAFPGLTQVEHLPEPERRVGDLSLVDQEPKVCAPVEHGVGNLVELDDDGRRGAAE